MNANQTPRGGRRAARSAQAALPFRRETTLRDRDTNERMEYNINFCIISAAYLSITAFFYRKQARVPSGRSALFDAMLLCGLLSLGLDITAAVIDRVAFRWPAWSIYVINIAFLLTVQATGVLFFYYVINLTGTYSRMPRAARVAILLPLLAVAGMILLSPFSRRAIFYLDEQHVYHHGSLHIALYITMALYLVTSFCVVCVRRRKLARLKFYTILAFLLVTLLAMLVQMNHPYLLVNSMANAFALTLMYYILEAPSAHVDALTGALNRTALQPVLRDAFDEGERCSLVIYPIKALHIVNLSFGIKGGDEALMAFAEYLEREHPGRHVFRNEGDVFCVLTRGGAYLDENRLLAMRAVTRTNFAIKAGEVTLETSLACINSEDCASASEMLALLESLMRMHRGGTLGDTVVADGAFKRKLERRERIERATVRALNEDRVEVYYQPIHDAAGRLCALEALVRVFDPEFGLLPTQEMVELAEQNGNILSLGERVLRKTCAFVRDNGVAAWGLDHVGVNLSALQCIWSELPEAVAGIMEEYGVPEGLIAFEVTETAAGALASVRENMERLSRRGVYFLLDDFGTGYANFQNMAALPYRCIKLDKSLLWDAQKSESRMRLLKGVVKIVHALGLTSLCEGVETEEQMRLLVSLGVSMLQGYYFSKPLPPERLADYARKAGVG